MPKSPSHHPSKHPPQTPVKWRSPRRCSNEGQIGNGNVSFQSNFLWNLFLLSASVVFPLIDWCLSFQGYCKDTILMEDSPVKWRSPRRCLNKDDGSVSFYFIFLKFFFVSFSSQFWLSFDWLMLILAGTFQRCPSNGRESALSSREATPVSGKMEIASQVLGWKPKRQDATTVTS